MFFLFPYGADVPLYYRPWATVGLIAANIAVFIVTLAPNGLGDDLVLHFGNGLHPTQWLTAAFMHIDIFHIVGNMMFLWPFGLVVEGKIGWWRFLLVYLGIAVTANFIFQVAMLGSTFQYALSASTAIYGLIGVSIIWAPKNELDVVYFVWVMFVLRTGTTEIAIMFFALFYIGLDFIGAILSGFAMSTPVLHLPGALLGAFVGVFMLKRGLVDCENWDIFAVWADRAGEDAPETQAATVSVEELSERHRARNQAALEHVRQQIISRNPQGALALDDKMRRTSPDWLLPRAELKHLIGQLHEQEIWEPSLRLMVEYVHRFPHDDVRMRLRLAQVLITKVDRPAQGIRVLAKIPAGSLDAPLEAARRKMLRQAEALRQAGAIELSTEDW